MNQSRLVSDNRLSDKHAMFINKTNGWSVAEALEKICEIIIYQKLWNIVRDILYRRLDSGDSFLIFSITQIPDNAN